MTKNDGAMRTSSRDRTNALFRKTAGDLAERLVRELSDRIHSVVLYGSVARGEAKRSSDIDILILAANPDSIRECVATIEVELDATTNYRTFLVSSYLTPERLERLLRIGSPYARDILQEGIILHDDGTFARVHAAFTEPSRRAAG